MEALFGIFIIIFGFEVVASAVLVATNWHIINGSRQDRFRDRELHSLRVKTLEKQIEALDSQLVSQEKSYKQLRKDAAKSFSEYMHNKKDIQ